MNQGPGAKARSPKLTFQIENFQIELIFKFNTEYVILYIQ